METKRCLEGGLGSIASTSHRARTECPVPTAMQIIAHTQLGLRTNGRFGELVHSAPSTARQGVPSH